MFLLKFKDELLFLSELLMLVPISKPSWINMTSVYGAPLFRLHMQYMELHIRVFLYIRVLLLQEVLLPWISLRC